MRAAWLAALALAHFAAAAQTMEPGQWEFTTTMTSSMVQQAQTSTFSQCVSKADAENPTHFTARGEAADCEVTPGTRTSDSYSWTVSCPKQGMRGIGKARFGRGTIESEMRVTVDMQGQKMEMQNNTKGRHVGPCTAK